MSTSKLQRYTSEQLYKRFGKYGLVENTRPQWLVSSRGERLELDFFIDKLSVAVEVQGKQHFELVPIFHSTKFDFEEQVRRDAEKLALCEGHGVQLLYICMLGDIPETLYSIQEKARVILATPNIWKDINYTQKEEKLLRALWLTIKSCKKIKQIRGKRGKAKKSPKTQVRFKVNKRRAARLTEAINNVKQCVEELSREDTEMLKLAQELIATY